MHLGPSRIPDGVSRDRCLETYIVNARTAILLAKDAPFHLLLEPMNPVDAPAGLFTDVDEAATLLRGALTGQGRAP